MPKKQGDKKHIIQNEVMRASGRNLANLSGGKPQSYWEKKYRSKAAGQLKNGGF